MDYGDDLLPERFWEKVYPCPITGCWYWGAATDGSGYGLFGTSASRCTRAHRVMYSALHGSVPRNLVVDHRCHDPNVCRRGVLCAHRSCVNPSHLRILTARENTLIGGGPPALNAHKTECSGCGERFDAVRGDGARICTTCTKNYNRRYYAARKAGVSSQANR